MNAIQIGIFDDHPIIMDGIVGFLTRLPNQINVVFTTSTKEDLLKNLSQQIPDVLILDVVAPDINGLDLFTTIISDFPSVKIIAYTSLKSTILVENLLGIGVKGFVNKTQSPQDLIEAIKDVNFDLISVPEKYKFLTSKFRQPANTNLTKREMEIIQLIAEEKTTQQIADYLTVSAKTIENHKINLFKKLEVKNSAGLILAATRLGYIS